MMCNLLERTVVKSCLRDNQRESNQYIVQEIYKNAPLGSHPLRNRVYKIFTYFLYLREISARSNIFEYCNLSSLS